MFLTGEFAKIARISKRTLQYYDDIGLLKPIHTDPQTGYRYYSSKQLPQLNRIIVLKELGLTLQQIARMLEGNVSDQEIRGMLLLQKAELEKKLLGDLDRFRRIETRLQAQPGDYPDVVLKSIPELEILSINHFCVTMDDVFRLIATLQQQLPSKVDNNHLGPLVTLKADDFSVDNIDVELGFVVEGAIPSTIALDNGVTLATRKLPAHTMATSVYLGHLDGSHVAYGAVGTWIETNDYQLVGQQREVFIELPRRVDEIVLEVQFPVEKRAPITIAR
jgi:DNA-binding transcriptional MerR regulator